MRGPALALLVVSVLWGTTFVAVKSGLSDASPLAFVGMRFGIAAIVAAVLLRGRPGLGAAVRAGLPLGLVLALAYASQTIGLTTTSPARSAFITGLNVALVPLWAMAVLGRRARALSLLGLAIAVPGLALLTSPGSGSWQPGDLWTVACAVFFALHVVLVNRVAPRHDAAGLLLSQLGVTALLCLAASPVLETPRIVVTGELVLALFVTAVLATTGTTWLQLRYQPRVDPTRAALIYATEPLFATLFSWLLIGETLKASAWIGGLLILAGMILSELGSGEPVAPAGGATTPGSRKGPLRSSEAPSRSRPS